MSFLQDQTMWEEDQLSPVYFLQLDVVILSGVRKLEGLDPLNRFSQ
jgi:hypothetical protein